MTASSKTFADLGVDPAICQALERAGIRSPFPIQELTLPLALSRADVIGQARTGTGKTLAFGIPLLQAIDTERPETQALVVVPTRELCLQVYEDLTSAGSERGVTTAALYGGKAIEAQSSTLDAGAQAVVGTPGRLLDLRRRGVLDLSRVATLVLDEADEMLDMGFLPDVEQLVEACNAERQTLLFSATMPSEVIGLARRYMHKPTFMRADVEEPQIAPGTRQVFLACHRLDKPAVLARILRTPGRGLCVVFTRTKRMADILVEELAGHGVTASAIHSNLRQDARERTLDRFRRGKVDVLCATEVAARGLDITDVTHVVNYDCPDDERMYLHRIGRTGRAGAGGIAVTLAVWNEQARLAMIKKALDIDAPTHEVFSTSPELDELFGPLDDGEGVVTPDPEPAVAPDPPADDAAPAGVRTEAAPGRRRARTRTRRRAPREGADGHTPKPSGKPATPPDGERTVRQERTVRKERTEPAERTEQRERTGSATRTRADTAREDGARTSARRTGRSRRGGGGGRRGQTPVKDPGATEAKPPQSHTESSQAPTPARGEGQPALHRPMTISHLP